MSLEHNVGYGLGLLAGVIVGLILVAVILKVTKTNRNMKCEYDERQSLVRGTGYKYGFFTFLICNFFYAILQSLDIRMPVDPSLAMVVIVVLAMSVQIVYCIWKDAYFSLNESKKRILTVFALAGVLNIGIGVMSLKDGKAVADGVLTFRSINLFCGILFLVIFAALLLKHLGAGGGNEEESD